MADLETVVGIQDSSGTPADIYVRGATDDTRVGNVGDSLKVAITSNSVASAIKTFSVIANNVQIGNGKSMISLVNASGSAVVLRLRELWIRNVQITGVTGTIGEFQLNKIVGHSAGTSLTPTAHDSNDALSGSATARTGSTVTTEGATYRRWLWSTDEWGAGPEDVESTDHSNQSLTPCYMDSGRWKAITLNANEGIHVKQAVNSTVGTFDMEMVFTQE